MFRQRTPRSFLWFVSLWAVLSIGSISCEGDGDDNNWIGTWAVETIDGQTYEQIFEEEGKTSIVTNNWTFNDDGTMEAEVALQISGAVSLYEMMGTYSLSGSNYTVTATTAEKTGFFETYPSVSSAVYTGTWSIKESTLTLSRDDGTIAVLKKK